jgi:hypothetical protein
MPNPKRKRRAQRGGCSFMVWLTSRSLRDEASQGALDERASEREAEGCSGSIIGESKKRALTPFQATEGLTLAPDSCYKLFGSGILWATNMNGIRGEEIKDKEEDLIFNDRKGNPKKLQEYVQGFQVPRIIAVLLKNSRSYFLLLTSRYSPGEKTRIHISIIYHGQYSIIFQQLQDQLL